MTAPTPQEEAARRLAALDEETIRLKQRLTEIPGERLRLRRLLLAFDQLEHPPREPGSRGYAQRAILDELARRGEASTAELAEVVSTRETASATLNVLLKRGLIRRVAMGRYRLAEPARAGAEQVRPESRKTIPASVAPGPRVVDFRKLERLSGPAPRKPCPTCGDGSEGFAIGMWDGHYVFRHPRCGTSFSSDGQRLETAGAAKPA